MENRILIEGYGSYLTDDYVTASVAEDHSFALVYTPVQHELVLKIPEKKWNTWQALIWYDPCIGVFVPVKDKIMIKKENLIKIKSSGKNECGSEDWVLIIGINNFTS